ncbi:hypothetical protein ACLOJK_001134 [Asimina triloba]
MDNNRGGGSGTIDRDYRALIKLGDGATTMQGKSIYTGDIYISGVPLYYGHGNPRKSNCTELDTKEVAGKIVFCESAKVFYHQVDVLTLANVTGAIIASNSSEFLGPGEFSIPLVVVSVKCLARRDHKKVYWKKVFEDLPPAYGGYEVSVDGVGIKASTHGGRLLFTWST